MNIASIDIGTNTVILLIAEIAEGNEIIPVVNEVSAPRIGKGVVPGSEFPAGSIERLMDVLDRYYDIIESHNCSEVLVAGTAALRNASNSAVVIEKVKQRYKWDLEIIPTFREAEYSYLGAIDSLKTSKTNLVIDIGGGSSEISFGRGTDITYNKSFPVGGVNTTEKFFTTHPPAIKDINLLTDHLDFVFEELNDLHLQPDNVYGISGTPVTIAAILNNLHKFDELILNGFVITRTAISETIKTLMALTPGEISSKFKDIVKGREDIILSSSIILLNIMEKLRLDRLTVSTKGLRYGLIAKHFAVNSQQ